MAQKNNAQKFLEKVEKLPFSTIVKKETEKYLKEIKGKDTKKRVLYTYVNSDMTKMYSVKYQVYPDYAFYGWKDRYDKICKRPFINSGTPWNTIVYQYLERAEKLQPVFNARREERVTSFIFARKSKNNQYPMIIEFREKMSQRDYRFGIYKDNPIKKGQFFKPRMYMNGAMLVRIWKDIRANQNILEDKRIKI